MGTHLNASDDDIISGINVTPLVDVVLVLLIIFLITAPVIYQQSLKVNLAKATTGESANQQELNITVAKSGELSWNGDPVDWKSLDGKLKSLGDKIGEKTAIISADREAQHGTVIELMDTLRKAGLTHLAFNVEKKPAISQ